MHNICTASAWIRPICMLCGSQTLLLKRQRGNMNIDKDSGLPSELVWNWKNANTWIYDSRSFDKKVFKLSILTLLSFIIFGYLISHFANQANYIKYMCITIFSVVFIFFITFRYMYRERHKEIVETIKYDWLYIRGMVFTEIQFSNYLMPGDNTLVSLSLDTLKGRFIEKLRALVRASEIGGSHEGDIKELIDDVEMFFGNIGRSSLYHFNKLTCESEVVYEGEKFSCTYFRIANPVSLGDLCAFLSRNNGVICESDTKRELPWCIPEDFIPHRKIWIVSAGREFDGFALIRIHAQYRQPDGVRICMPNELKEEEFKSNSLGMVFVRLDKVRPNE